MDFSLSPELTQLRARVRALVDDVLQPIEDEAEREPRPALGRDARAHPRRRCSSRASAPTTSRRSSAAAAST